MNTKYNINDVEVTELDVIMDIYEAEIRDVTYDEEFVLDRTSPIDVALLVRRELRLYGWRHEMLYAYTYDLTPRNRKLFNYAYALTYIDTFKIIDSTDNFKPIQYINSDNKIKPRFAKFYAVLQSYCQGLLDFDDSVKSLINQANESQRLLQDAMENQRPRRYNELEDYAMDIRLESEIGDQLIILKGCKICLTEEEMIKDVIKPFVEVYDRVNGTNVMSKLVKDLKCLKLIEENQEWFDALKADFDKTVGRLAEEAAFSKAMDKKYGKRK